MSNLSKKKNIIISIVKLISTLYSLDDAVLLEFIHSSELPSKNVTAVSTRDYKILINLDWLIAAEEYEIYITVFHEMRHIYQFCCIDFAHKYPHIFNEPQERIQKWAIEVENYYVSDVDYDQKYLKQDIEIDAIAFAKYMMQITNAISVQVPEVIKEAVINRTQEIRDKLEFE